MENKLLHNYDPNGVGVKGSLFGLPFNENNAEIVIIPVPWDVTVSYGAGTCYGPQAVLEASPQLDLEVNGVKDAWRIGLSLTAIDQAVLNTSVKLRQQAEAYISKLENGEIEQDKAFTSHINQESENLNSWVAYQTNYYLQRGKIVGLLGGDHSTSLGFIKSLTNYYEEFGVLQIDAHADLRKDYEGFVYSHASIMNNVMKMPQVSKLVQVGVRDYCQEELERIDSDPRIMTFFDQNLKEAMYEGEAWEVLCQEIIDNLPRLVYLSFDIDGLDPKLCPSTGTPVPGGFEFEQALYLIKKIVESGRKIIGFDLVEIGFGPDEWDANVGARLLYRLSILTAISQGKLAFNN